MDPRRDPTAGFSFQGWLLSVLLALCVTSDPVRFYNIVIQTYVNDRITRKLGYEYDLFITCHTQWLETNLEPSCVESEERGHLSIDHFRNVYRPLSQFISSTCGYESHIRHSDYLPRPVVGRQSLLSMQECPIWTLCLLEDRLVQERTLLPTYNLWM